MMGRMFREQSAVIRALDDPNKSLTASGSEGTK
jgi:hypothetical protein